MIRNLKVLVAAAIALAAFGAFSASGAHAAVEFHCSVEPCTGTLKPDEAANTKTSHHVFIIENAAKTESASFTCGQLHGEGTASTKTFAQLEVKNLNYTECFVNGSGKVTVDMNGCKYNFTASGTVTVTGCNEKEGKKLPIELTIPEIGCTYFIPEQGPLTGVTYHNIGTSPTRQITVSVNTTVPTVTGVGGSCPVKVSQTLTGTYTTGNTIVTGETDNAEAKQVDTWWE